MLRQAGVEDLIEHAATAEDARNSKPDADIVEAALAKAGVQADLAVMFGVIRRHRDVEAARRAGVASIIFRCGGWWKDDDFAGAMDIYDDPAQLLAKWPGTLWGA